MEYCETSFKFWETCKKHAILVHFQKLLPFFSSLTTSSMHPEKTGYLLKMLQCGFAINFQEFVTEKKRGCAVVSNNSNLKQ